MADLDDPPVLEGFICPICKRDLGEAVKLLSHFQEEHSEEQDLIKTFKDLLDKAKKKILKQDSLSGPVVNIRRISNQTVEYNYDLQEIGTIISHKKMFDTFREERIQRLSVPTNQLVIRLERLLRNMPSDPIKRKAHEQNVVPWLDGESVHRCPNCAGAFYLARRKHHCRTCGGIMCNDCSHFMSLTTARRILDTPLEEEPAHSSTEQHLRLCIHCISLLEVREERRESRNVKPIITQFYERLSEYKEEAEQLSAQYLNMSTSLNSGESIYNLEEAQEVKIKLLKLAENIDALSSKIGVLGKDTERPPQGPALRLQNMVRSATATYLKDKLLNMPVLPTEEKLLEAQAKRRDEVTARIHEEKLKRARLNNIPNHIKPTTSGSNHRQSNDPTISLGQGWVPEKMKVNESDDPLIEQMNIIRSYIKEAKAAHKYDEVASLEENLRELKKEFWKKQTNEEIARSGESSEAASLSSYDDIKQNVSSESESN